MENTLPTKPGGWSYVDAAGQIVNTTVRKWSDLVKDPKAEVYVFSGSCDDRIALCRELGLSGRNPDALYATKDGRFYSRPEDTLEYIRKVRRG